MRGLILALLAVSSALLGCSSPQESTPSTPFNPAPTPSADTQAPSIPTNVVATAVSSTSIQVNWTASTDTGGSGVAGYQVRRNGSAITTVATNSFTDTGLQPGTQYSYTISAFDSAAPSNQSVPSGAATASTQNAPPTQDTTPPSTPMNLQATLNAANAVVLSWGAATDTGGSGIAGYRVFRGATLLTTINQTSFVDTAVTVNTTYAYTVMAFDAAGNASPASASASITVPAASFAVTITIEGMGAVEDAAHGISCTATCTRQVAQGTALTLTARASTNYSFTTWAGACTNMQSCNVTVNAATAVTARFTATTPPPPAPASGSLFVPVVAQGSVDVTLHPGATIQTGAVTKVAFGVPFPRGFANSAAQLRVTDANGVEIASAVSELARWRGLGGNAITESIRAALFYVDYTFANSNPVTIKVQWGTPRTMTLSGTQPAATSLWVPISSGVNPTEFPSVDDVREPAVYATLPADWLGQALLRTRTQVINQTTSLAWFDSNSLNFGRTAVNEVAATVLSTNLINYSGGEEPWLFDRSLSLFGLYYRTGDLQWLRHAHRSAQWYAKKVDANGIFSLASYNHDLKYSYGLSLATDLYLTGDTTLTAPILRVATAGEREWQTTYSTSMGFWTERHHTYALLAALTAFEVTGQAQHATRATALAQLTFSMSQNAAHCPLHTIEQHEGDAGDQRMMCSPWMQGLLADAMLRYYMDSEDTEVLRWLASMGDYVRDFAIYDGGLSGDAALNGIMMPWYMVGPTGHLDDGLGWGDVEHTCDVAALVAKGVWAKGRLGQDASSLRATTNQLISSCQFIQNYWHRPANTTVPEWRLNPARKFNWWFGTTTDLGWMLNN